jgi:hypothetical protein
MAAEHLEADIGADVAAHLDIPCDSIGDVPVVLLRGIARFRRRRIPRCGVSHRRRPFIVLEAAEFLSASPVTADDQVLDTEFR